jgi:hypothetical protein
MYIEEFILEWQDPHGGSKRQSGHSGEGNSIDEIIQALNNTNAFPLPRFSIRILVNLGTRISHIL